MHDIRNFIDGSWRSPSGTAEWDVVDPSTGEILANRAGRHGG